MNNPASRKLFEGKNKTSVSKRRRVLLKLSGEALMGEMNYGLDPQIVDRIAVEIQSVVNYLLGVNMKI